MCVYIIYYRERDRECVGIIKDMIYMFLEFEGKSKTKKFFLNQEKAHSM